MYGEVFSAVCQGEHNHLSIILCLKQVLMDLALQDNHSTFFSVFVFFWVLEEGEGAKIISGSLLGGKETKKKQEGCKL